jgi:hypothetical protein
MRTLNQQEIAIVTGSGKLADWIAKIKAAGKTTVTVDVVAKPEGSTKVDVKSLLADVLVNVVWGK